MARQIESMPGVAHGRLQQLHRSAIIQDPKNRVFVQMMDENVPKVHAGMADHAGSNGR